MYIYIHSTYINVNLEFSVLLNVFDENADELLKSLKGYGINKWQ